VQTYFVSDCQIDEKKHTLCRGQQQIISYIILCKLTFKWFSGFWEDLHNKTKIPHWLVISFFCVDALIGFSIHTKSLLQVNLYKFKMGNLSFSHCSKLYSITLWVHFWLLLELQSSHLIMEYKQIFLKLTFNI
jgi:hypothetical protein